MRTTPWIVHGLPPLAVPLSTFVHPAIATIANATAEASVTAASDRQLCRRLSIVPKRVCRWSLRSRSANLHRTRAAIDSSSERGFQPHLPRPSCLARFSRCAHPATRHDRADAPRRTDVAQRIAVDRDEIRARACGYLTDLAFEAERIRSVDGTRSQCVFDLHAEFGHE